MTEAALQIFNSLNGYFDLQKLIDNGDAEGLLLECKAPSEPKLTRELKAHLATALSGFANTAGGVIIWGISTTKHEHSKLDILTQIEPIGNCRKFAQEIERAIPTLTMPSITASRTKVIYENKTKVHATRGLVLTYVPQIISGPIQSNIDEYFYFRNSDEFLHLPYQMLQRLFAAADVPDLYPVFNDRLVSIGSDGMWKVPIGIENRSAAVADHVEVSVCVENVSSCDKIVAERLRDISPYNPGKKIFIHAFERVIHRGLNEVAGVLNIGMRKEKRAKRVLKLTITIFSNKMRARRWNMSVQLAKKGFSVRNTGEQYLY